MGRAAGVPGRSLRRQKLDPASRGVDAQLQRLEVQRPALGVADYDLPVDHAALRKLGVDRGHQLGKVARHRPLVAAADSDLVAIALTARSGVTGRNGTRWDVHRKN